MKWSENQTVVRTESDTCLSALLVSAAVSRASRSSCVDNLTDLNDSELFCRFATCIGNAPDTSNVLDINSCSFSPLASHLLSRQDRWAKCGFDFPPKPLVFDLTPNVIGPSEGFVQGGCSIHAGLGFDPDRHISWKVRVQSLRSLLPLIFDSIALSGNPNIRWFGFEDS